MTWARGFIVGGILLCVNFSVWALQAHAAPFAHVTSSETDTISITYTETDTVAATVPVGRTPSGVAINRAGSRVYVPNKSGSDSPLSNPRILRCSAISVTGRGLISIASGAAESSDRTPTPTVGPCGRTCLGLAQSCTAIVDGMAVPGACYAQTEHGCECGPEGPPPTRTATATSTPQLSGCAGDCDGARIVTVDELVRCVQIALATQPVTACSACDANADGLVTVNELVAAVDNALNGCPP